MIYSNFLCAIIDTQKMCIFYLLLQSSFTLFYSILEMKMCEFFHENLTDQAVILFNCPKGRKVTYVPLKSNHRSKGEEIANQTFYALVFDNPPQIFVSNLDVRCLRAHTAGSVISSLSPAAIIVRTRASIPPTWQTITYQTKQTINLN